MRNFLLLFILLSTAFFAYVVYVTLYVPNINAERKATVKIPTGAGFDDVMTLLHEKKVLKTEWSFRLVSYLKNYPANIHGGYYEFNAKMNNRQIVNILRYGMQTPVTLVVYNIRTKSDFSGLIGRTLELDSNAILAQLDNSDFCRSLNTDTANILSSFIVDNYELYWNTSFEKLISKLGSAYQSFWNTERRAKAEALQLTPAQVTVLASITEKEVIRDSELPRVAGVYLNRLRIGMPLQADPTLVFALKDFTAQRVTNLHKDFDTPYNTYKYKGLPPGPICMPRKKSIDAVLNFEKHRYLYFCANPDMSGYSIFSETYQQQMRVAAEYRKKLNTLNIH